jgi:hypothetical protein
MLYNQVLHPQSAHAQVEWKNGKNSKLLLLEGPSFEFNPSPPSIFCIVGKYINFITNLKSTYVATSSL